jgi:hypothetical protein
LLVGMNGIFITWYSCVDHNGATQQRHTDGVESG